MPERIPGVVRNRLLRLVLYVEPDERQYRDQGKSGDETSELVTALCQFGHEQDDRSRHEVLSDEPRHDFSSGR